MRSQNHQHDDDHDHAHPHPHNHGHDHGHHQQATGLWGWITTLFHLHGHSHPHATLVTDQPFADNTAGIRVVWWALAALALTSVIQIIIVLWSGSVALLADTLHNVGDGLNSVPLLIAFYLARRVATRRYTYGFGRAEDVAGIFIVLSIAFSAGLIFWESIQKFLYPEPITHLKWVAVAAMVGFLGNEAVALLQIRVGRKIGSAALVADGLHARTDGLTSLAVLLAVGGTWLGLPILDPIIGLLIGVAILFITRAATVTMWYRLMDAIEPEILTQAEAVIKEQSEVKRINRLRMRWIGHRLHAEVHIAVDPHLSIVESHEIAEKVRHDLFHNIVNLSEAVVHVDPWSEKPEKFHELTAHHEPIPKPVSL
jgi:cation diffusion facilitator family transporter